MNLSFRKMSRMHSFSPVVRLLSIFRARARFRNRSSPKFNNNDNNTPAFETKETKKIECQTDASCGDCVVAENCGYCRSRLTSGDGTSTITAFDCRAGDDSGPYSLNQPCDSWSFISCAAMCKNDCSGHGVCQQDTTCLCTLGYEGTDCSTVMPVNNNVDVLIPIAFICAFLAVVILVYVQVSTQRCWNRGYTSDDEEEESSSIEEPKFLSKADTKRKKTLRSRPARG